MNISVFIIDWIYWAPVTFIILKRNLILPEVLTNFATAN